MASRASGAKAGSSTRTSAPKSAWQEAIPSGLSSINEDVARNAIKRLRMLQQAYHDYQEAVASIPKHRTAVAPIVGEAGREGLAMILQGVTLCKTCRNFSLGTDCQHCQHASPVLASQTETMEVAA